MGNKATAPEQDLGLPEFEEEDLGGLDRGDEVESDEPESAEEQEPEVEETGEEPDDSEESAEDEAESESEPESEDESEDEPEDESDEPDEPERAEEPEPKPENRIPQSRFNEVNERRKAAEQRARELEQRLQSHDPSKAVQFDFEAKEAEYMEAVLDGRTKEASAIRQEIRAAEQTAFTEMAKRQAEQARESTKAELEFESTVRELNQQYPTFDPESESYSQDLVDEVLEMQSGFVSRGYSPAAAVKRAAMYVARFHGLDNPPEEESRGLSEAKEAPEPKPRRQKKTNVKQKLEQAAKQPPKQQGKSSKEEAPAKLDDMTEDEFDALPEATKARLRGDVF